IGFFLYQLWGRFGVLLKMDRADGRDYGPSTWAVRLRNTLVYAFGQYKFFRDGGVAGILHIIVFWGFLVLGVQVATMFARGWFEGFVLPGFRVGLLGLPYGLLKDFFQAAVAVGVCVLLYRWIVQKPQRLMGFLPAEAKLHTQSHWE